MQIGGKAFPPVLAPDVKAQEALGPERPEVLLFVASNSPSNPAKLWLDEFKRNTRPSFRIKVWERKTLETLLFSQAGLLLKYRLDSGLHSSVHPAHLSYVTEPASNSLEYLFYVFEKTFDSATRELI